MKANAEHRQRTDKPPEVRTLASQLTDQIQRDIIRGELAPNSKLKLTELSRRYSTGVIPLREALSRLVRSGFVTAEDQRGFRVTGISEAELLDITRVRRLLECEALRDSIARADLAWEARINAALTRLRRVRMTEPDVGHPYLANDWELAHEAFHAVLLSNCGSPLLLRHTNLLREQTSRYRHLSVGGTRRRNVLKEHLRLADAVLTRDADTACKLLSDHIETTTAAVLRNVPAS
jgi:GntR family carbon starvation induced transcriptional regulator